MRQEAFPSYITLGITGHNELGMSSARGHRDEGSTTFESPWVPLRTTSRRQTPEHGNAVPLADGASRSVHDLKNGVARDYHEGAANGRVRPRRAWV